MRATAAFSDMFEANGLSIDVVRAGGAGGFADLPVQPRRVASARKVARLFGSADAQRMMGVDNESDQVP
jgi:hypothetical protein